MKGLILSGGKGSRLRPLTYTGAKQLVPIANKPVLFYAIESLVSAGVTELGIVVGETKDQIVAAVGDGSAFGARVTYIEQEAPLGLAHGVKIARPFLGEDKFVLFLGDNFVKGGIAAQVVDFKEGESNCMLVLCPVKSPQQFGVADLVEGKVARVTEKPLNPQSNLAITGVYMFDRHVFDAISSIRPSARNELEITDAIQWLLDQGFKVAHHILKEPWIDTGKKDDVLDANRLILEDIEARIEGEVDGQSRIVGRVVLEKGSQVLNSVLRGPLAIGKDTVIVDSYLGPYTSIYFGCRIEKAEIEHSVVLENSLIIDVPQRIEESLIGRNVRIGRGGAKPAAYKLVLGDHSNLDMP